MADHPAPQLEDARLAALDRYDVLDTPREEAFDRITRLVRRVCDVPIATVTFLDGHRQFFKSEVGLGASESERGPALCNATIRGEGPLVVSDTREDSRFAGSAFVTGEPGIRAYAGVPLRTPDGLAIGTLCAMDRMPRPFTPDEVATLEDLARLTMDELELRRLATTDALTHALSRRGFRDEGMRAVALALRHGHDLTCLMLDLDRFKAVNDGFGHATGDRVLAAAAAACRETLRATDVLGRMGGEEFAVLLQHTGRKAGLAVAEKLRAAIAAMSVPAGDETVRITVSVGLAALDRTMGDIDALLQRADGALYAAKAGGRDRVVAWEQPEAEKATVRRRVLKAGRIAFNGRRSSIDCTVRALSDRDARLDVFTSAGIPAAFDLVIDADRFVRACRVVGHGAKHLDVAFD